MQNNALSLKFDELLILWKLHINGWYVDNNDKRERVRVRQLVPYVTAPVHRQTKAIC